MLLEIKNLKTHFSVGAGKPSAKAVDGIDLSIVAGEMVALVGESGCGKSVTAFSVMGLLPDNGFHPEGEILFDGTDLLTAAPARLRDIRGNQAAMIFQEPMSSLNPLMRIGPQVVEPLRIHRGLVDKKEGERQALELLRHVGIPAPESRLRDYPHQLSGGMRQRVMIAMALACRPRLLIADEPTTALDVTIQAQILRLMKDLQTETGMAMLFITHDLGVVNQIADRVFVMYAGKIMEHGSRQRIFNSMAHPYTRGLFASLPDREGEQYKLRTIPGSVPPATAYPAGCRFHPRCLERFDLCPRQESPLHEVDSMEHRGACHLLAPAASVERDAQAWSAREKRSRREAAVDWQEAHMQIEGLKTHFPVKRGILQRVVGHIKAVDDINLTIPRGTTMALVGESGCGKTTVGYSVLRLLAEARGRVVVNGQDILGVKGSSLRSLRRHLQIVFQDPFSALSPRMTVGAIVREGLDVHCRDLGLEERQEKAMAALREVGLEESAYDRYPHEFSGGQRQRISIARALVLAPQLLVLDEPTSSLDVSVQAQILNLLVDLQARHHMTYLFITHDLGVVRYMADTVAVMYLGRVVEQATCQELFANPRHPYTKALLSALPRTDVRDSLMMRLNEEVPSPLNPPTGCHFHPRCPVFGAAGAASELAQRCPRDYPELRMRAGHRTACHAVPDESRQ